MSNKCFNFILTRTIIRYILELYLGGINMNSLVKNGLIIVGIYLILVSYLFFAANRVENLENNNKKMENVTRNISE